MNESWRRPGAWWLLMATLLMLTAHVAVGGTTGKITGLVLDAQKQPVLGATVVVLGQKFGAFTDPEGHYDILNLPPGYYDVSISCIGWKTLVTKGVEVSADQTSRLDATMEQTTLAMEEVVVTAERPPVDVNLTSARQSLSSREIESLPVQDVQDIVNLQAGVVDGHFRGGRIGEVQFQVDGVSVNDPYNNESTLRLDRSICQEVQVISGTFDAEYGQAMSGVVNAVLKEGSKEFKYTGEVYGGGFAFPGREADRRTDDSFEPLSQQNYQFSMSGPSPLPETLYLFSIRRSENDGFASGERRFVPTDSSNFESKVWRPSGDGKKIALEYTRQWSGAVKLSNKSFASTALSYSAVWNLIDTRRNDWAYRLNPDGLRTQETASIAHGIDVIRTLSATTFLQLSFRQNYFDYHDWKYEDLYDPRYDAAGPALGDPAYENGAIVQGVDFTRFVQKSDIYVWKGALSSQLNPGHLVKLGGEFQVPTVRFGTPGYLRYASENGVQRLVRHVNEPPDFPPVRTYHPVIASAFAQDQYETTELSVRYGLRCDYFDARSTVPGDLANPANTIQGAPESRPIKTTAKTVVAPRLGVAYPITDRAGLHFAYGHFYQFPSIGDILANADYGILGRLQAGGITYSTRGNPDVKPEKTIQYEFGWKQVLNDDLGYDASVFYKDIRDLIGVEFIDTYNGATYTRLTNVDFGSVIGFTLAVDHRRIGPVAAALDYTWQFAQGNSSDPLETATRASAGEDPRPRQVPFNWDQRHTFNLTATLEQPDRYIVSAAIRAASGQPYTPILEAGFGNGLDTNSGRKPAGFRIDVRAERQIPLGGRKTNLFARVFNLFDTRFFNNDVFSSTGSPYYSRFPETDRNALIDPTRLFPPRRVEIGLTLNPGF
ncbi:MAG: TonB-dependent receptor [Candidatus Eisenbacteria bacterium]|nr:TonB-dependent receptor [Candidatus Eisenbacteria bacterium]